jgi:KUP system potassium uptake protein
MSTRGSVRQKRRSHRKASGIPAIPEIPLATRGGNSGGKRATPPSEYLLFCVIALGVVFGDIGTSPIYAFRESFLGKNPVLPTVPNILGVLSLVFWTLTIVISFKYLVFVMRLDNNGEGGILALSSLLRSRNHNGKGSLQLLMILGMFGACLLYGDGMITPAISVLSAIEGLKLAIPSLEHLIIPITVAVLFLLFLFQRQGTSSVGLVFGPVMLLWFSTIALLGVVWIIREPQVLAAVSPAYGVRFFMENGGSGFKILGSVVLVVTGGEALYADLGHFGRGPIRVAWFALVFPALLLNYFGQGAQLLTHPGQAEQPFFNLAPGWALIPLVVLATVATVIASQAVISGAFSLTRQASLLRLLPPMKIIQTSEEEVGQIYIPVVNWLLMIMTIGLVLGFRSSSNLAGAYGVAVTTTMVITTILATVIVRQWKLWNPWIVGVVSGLFLIVDLSFFGANILKVVEGGWFPLAVAAIIYGLMSTWKRGRESLARRAAESQTSLEQFLAQLTRHPVHRVPGTGVFLTGHPNVVPLVLAHHLKHNQVLHEQVILLTLMVDPQPRVFDDKMLEVKSISHGFHRVTYHYGFMQSPNVPLALERSSKFGLQIDLSAVTYYLRRQTVIPSNNEKGMAFWREKLFALMARNSTPSAVFFHIPTDCVVELGVEVEI